MTEEGAISTFVTQSVLGKMTKGVREEFGYRVAPQKRKQLFTDWSSLVVAGFRVLWELGPWVEVEAIILHLLVISRTRRPIQ